MENLIKEEHLSDREMKENYKPDDYLDSLIGVLIEKLGYDKVAYTPGFILRIGDGNNCIPLFEARDFLENNFGIFSLLRRRQLNSHLSSCTEGCREAIDQAIEEEIQREREGLSSYIHSVGINQAISELENGSKKLLNQFPLLKDYRDKIWNTVIEELKPDENQQ